MPPTTVGYADIRHAAVPLERLLPALVVGAWIGSGRDDVLRFASGEDARTQPRHIFTISIADQ